jgi:hypothetical protein
MTADPQPTPKAPVIQFSWMQNVSAPMPMIFSVQPGWKVQTLTFRCSDD